MANEPVKFILYGINPEAEEIYKLGTIELEMEVELENALITVKGCEKGKVFVKKINLGVDYEDAIEKAEDLCYGESEILVFCNFREEHFLVSCVSLLEEDDYEDFLSLIIDGFARKIES